MARNISLLAFFILWSERQGWEVPALHVRVCHWLEHKGTLALLMLPRGHAKSTIVEIYNAWRYYRDPTFRILHQGESNGTALKTSRGTQNVLRHHPLTRGMLPDGLGTVEQWWVDGSTDARNANMYARGILSNVTSSRADECQNDDVEVQNNIATPEAREKMRFRLGEQTHILVPGGSKLYVGTPHTHDSIYDEVRKMGADCLIVPMFSKSHRIERADRQRVEVGFQPEYVFAGIGPGSRLLKRGVDYRVEGNVTVLAAPGGELVDCYSGAAWPERFDAKEMQKRRRETMTINEWDSQYQLQSKPVTQVRLDPARIIPYDANPRLHQANNATAMFLGRQRIVGAASRWDPSSGKLKSDVSGFAVSLQDEGGRRYLHRVVALTGDVAEFAEDGKTITGGQVFQLCNHIEELKLPRVSVETNGIGKFAPTVLRAAIRQRKLTCGVVEVNNTVNKNKRILETMEPLLLSRGMLWAHVDVLRGPLWNQMRDWNPGIADQPDDYIDASAGAIAEQPERFRENSGIPIEPTGNDWRQTSGTYEVAFET
jgi:hypothetical protein